MSTANHDAAFATTESLIALEKRWGAPNYAPIDIVVEHAEGVWLYDVEGRRYFDFIAAFSCVNYGHGHPRILRALHEQANRVTLTSRACRSSQLAHFCEELATFCRMESVLPMNTGTDAVETAIKMARRWGYHVKGIPRDKAEIIVCDHNFHGRTTTILGFSTDRIYSAGFGPFTPGFVLVPFGDAAAFERAVTSNTAAFLVEPIQGDAGVRVPPAGYLAAVRDICTRNDVLFLADEVLTGLGRTGTRFGCDHDGVVPDAYILGKALSGGTYPVSAVVSRHDVMGVLDPGSHGSTYSGNPLGCAVARTALQVLEDEQLADRAAKSGTWLLSELRALRDPRIADVRGKGLMIGIELTVPARPFCEALKTLGVLCKETAGNVLRLMPPLVVTRAELEWAANRLREVFCHGVSS